MQTTTHFSSETTDARTWHSTLQVLKENNSHSDCSTHPVKIPPPPYEEDRKNILKEKFSKSVTSKSLLKNGKRKLSKQKENDNKRSLGTSERKRELGNE